jgi:hypothetical protein
MVIFLLPVSVAEENLTNGNETEIIEQTEKEIPTSEELEFRIGPTVKLRPVNDQIDSDQPGLIELYMKNPSVNDVTLNADVEISVPSGIHVYGEGLSQASAAGTASSTFSVPPGNVRTIYMNVKAEEVGTYTLHFSGLYYPENNKDDFNPISLTHPFTVDTPSKNPENPPLSDKDTIDGSDDSDSDYSVNAEATPGFGALMGIIIFGIIGLMRLTKRGV